MLTVIDYVIKTAENIHLIGPLIGRSQVFLVSHTLQSFWEHPTSCKGPLWAWLNPCSSQTPPSEPDQSRKAVLQDRDNSRWRADVPVAVFIQAREREHSQPEQKVCGKSWVFTRLLTTSVPHSLSVYANGPFCTLLEFARFISRKSSYSCNISLSKDFLKNK